MDITSNSADQMRRAQSKKGRDCGSFTKIKDATCRINTFLASEMVLV